MAVLLLSGSLGFPLSVRVAEAAAKPVVKQEPAAMQQPAPVQKDVPAASQPAVDAEALRQAVQKDMNTAAAALMCAGTYHMYGTSQEHELFSDYGWEVTPCTFSKGKTQVNFAIAVGKKKVNGFKPTILAFRGSQSRKDWNVNLSTSLVPFKESRKGTNSQKDQSIPSIHEGFDRYARTALDCPMDIDGDGKPDELVSYLKKHPERHLLITGHSLGGAAATLFAERLVEAGVPANQVPVITFGAPAVGNKAFAEKYGSSIDLLRVVTSIDPVPGSLQTFFGGGFTQFGKVEKFDLSKKYTDYQHPVSFYLDLAVRKFYDSLDAAVAAKALPPLPESRTEGDEPMAALAVYHANSGFDDRFSPDLGRFVADEYKSLLPRFTMVGNQAYAGKEPIVIDEEQLTRKAREAGAKYLIIAIVDQQRLGQTRQWYLTLSQRIRTLEGPTLSTMNMGSANVTFDRGVTQATLALLEDQKKQLKTMLPFALDGNQLWNWGSGAGTAAVKEDGR